MSKIIRESLPKLLLLTIVTLSLAVLLYGLKTWDSYNRRRSAELQHHEAVEKLAKYEALFSSLQAEGIHFVGHGQPAIDGIVEAVNQSDQLVVLSVGKEQKVERGFLFAVNRGGETIGKVQVIEVYDDLSGARITYVKDANEIEVGDRIVSSSF